MEGLEERLFSIVYLLEPDVAGDVYEGLNTAMSHASFLTEPCEFKTYSILGLHKRKDGDHRRPLPLTR